MPPDAGVEVPVEVERPALVVSGTGAYWHEEEPVESAGDTANAAVDAERRYQSWYGFGGAFTEKGGYLLSQLDATERQRALELLFDRKAGAAFQWGRVPIGADGYALSRYTHDEVAADYSLESFSIERDHDHLIPYIQGALDVAPDLQLWALPWTPPTWMKQNGGFDGGSIKTDAQTLSAYALYLARFLEAYRDLGIDIDVLHPQADPEFEFDYPSCLWEVATLQTFVRDYLVPELLSRALDVDVWLGAFAGQDAEETVQTLMSDPVLAEGITGFGLQWGARDAVPSVAAAHGWPVMQTEHKPGNFPYLVEGFDPERAPNDHGHAIESWQFIREWVEAGVHSYSAWNMILDPAGLDLDVVRPWPKSSLLVVDPSTGALVMTPAYYVFRHLSYFVEPGAVRLQVNGVEALAFENPDGAIATVVFNPEATAEEVALAVKGTVVRFTVPAEGWATLYW